MCATSSSTGRWTTNNPTLSRARGSAARPGRSARPRRSASAAHGRC
ncbi:hypothetical protein [Mycolicibacterium sp. 120320]